MSRSRRLRNRSGQALVEFALTVPILLFLVVGIIEFGRLMSAQQTITDTAREAARRAVVADDLCANKHDEIAVLIRRRLAGGGLNPDGWSNQDGFIRCGLSGDSTTVQLTYAYPMRWLRPFMETATIALSSRTNMRQE